MIKEPKVVSKSPDTQKDLPEIPSIDCPVCYQTFDPEKNIPVIFSCNHTFCRDCSYKIRPQCPICKENIIRNVNEYTITYNFALIELMKQIEVIQWLPLCPTHNKSIDMICHDCSELICPDCHDSAHAHHLLRRPSPLVLALLRRVHADQSALRGFPQTGDVREYEGLHAKWGRLLEEGAIEELETVQRTLAEIESMLAAVKTAMCNRIHAVKRQLSAALAQVDEMVQCRLETDPTEETEEALAEIGWDSRKEEYGEIERKYRQVQDERLNIKKLFDAKNGIKSILKLESLPEEERPYLFYFVHNGIQKITSILKLEENSILQKEPTVESLTDSIQSIHDILRQISNDLITEEPSSANVSFHLSETDKIDEANKQIPSLS